MVQWLGLGAFTAGAWVRSLVGELRSQKPQGAAKIFFKININKILFKKKKKRGGFPGGIVVKNLPANSGDTGLSPGPGRSHMPRRN